MRNLKPIELYNGIYVQCLNYGTYGSKVREVTNAIYQIIIENDRVYYTELGCDWRMDSNLVINGWYETERTIQLNRDNKLNSIL